MLCFHFFIFGCAARISELNSAARSELLAREERRVSELTNPVDKTKSYIVISEVLLSFAAKSFEGDEMEDFEFLLRRYLSAISSARDTIVGSGLDAARHPDGFKDLELALGEHLRTLQYMSTQPLVWDRKPFDEAISVMTSVRNEMLRLLTRDPPCAANGVAVWRMLSCVHEDREVWAL